MSDMSPHLYLAHASMITPVGANALMTAAAVRARIRRGSATAYTNRDFNPMTLASVPDDALPPLHDALRGAGLATRAQRLLRLIAPPLAHMLDVYSPRKPFPVFLAGPQTLPGCPNAIPSQFLRHIATQTGIELDFASSRLYATGRAAGLQEIELAFRYLEQTDNDYILIGAVDSYRDPFLLEKLDKEDRINATGVMNGFIPGEAAGFLLLATEHGMARLRTAPLARIHRPGLADEPGHRYSETPYRGDGLAQAFTAAIANSDRAPIGTLYSSQNGEHFWAKEYGVAFTRNQAAFQDPVEHEHPAECLGDLGAACGPVMIGLAALDLQKGWRRGPALVYCSSDTAYRTAAVVAAV